MGTNSWNLVSCGANEKRRAFNFYLNGVAHGEDYNYQTIEIPNVAGTLNFGSFDGANFYDGQFDEFRIWTLARSESELATFKTENILERTSGLIGEYRFDGSLEDASSYRIMMEA